MSSEHLVYTTSFNKTKECRKGREPSIVYNIKTEVRKKGLGPKVKRGEWSRDPIQKLLKIALF